MEHVITKLNFNPTRWFSNELLSLQAQVYQIWLILFDRPQILYEKFCRTPWMKLHWLCEGLPKAPYTVLREDLLFKLTYPAISCAQAKKNQFLVSVPKWITGTGETKQTLPRAVFCVEENSLVPWQQTSWMLAEPLDIWHSEPAVCRQFWKVTFLGFTKYIYTITSEMLKMFQCFPKHKQNLHLY